jgi:DNA-damage-inducible protein J
MLALCYNECLLHVRKEQIMATMTIRCDEADKKAAAAVAEFYGFDLSSVTRALWKQMARTKRIPLECNTFEPNAESLKAIEETKALIAQGGTGQSFESAEELLAAARA